MALDKKIAEIKNHAFKAIRLSDDRHGIIFQQSKDVSKYHQFLKESGLKPTTIHLTMYGYAFKYNDVSSLKENWPYSMIPPNYDPDIQGPIYKKWDNFNYHGYDEAQGKVHLTQHTPIKGGSRMKRVKVPFPAMGKETGKSTTVMTAIRPNGWTMGGEISHYKFTSYVWSLLPDSGNWLCEVNKGLTPMIKDKIGEFITKSVKSGKTKHTTN